jgi:hypothetical protein
MIRAFSDGDLDAAAALLEQRHARHRQVFPQLPAEVDYREEIAARSVGRVSHATATAFGL